MARKTTSSDKEPTAGEAAEDTEEHRQPADSTATGRATGLSGAGKEDKEDETPESAATSDSTPPEAADDRNAHEPDDETESGRPETVTGTDTDSEPQLGTEADPDTDNGLTPDHGAGQTDTAYPEPSTPAPMTTEQVVIRKGGLLPLLIGGAAAAAIGFAAALFGFSEGGPLSGGARDEAFQTDVNQRLADQAAQLQDMSDRVESLSTGLEEGGADASVSDLDASVASLTDRISTAETRLENIAARLTEIEKAPVARGTSDEAVAAYESELRALQEAMAEQRAEVEAMTAEARQMEAEAEATAAATLQRAALTRIQTAIDSGTGFASALADLRSAGIEPPPELAGVAEGGVEPLTVLQADFPDAARAALAASRSATAGEETAGGFAAFLRTQLGARSLEPREGNDPDAILSRAEAATRDGRLQDALAEIEALPEDGRAELADWSERANKRLRAIAAAQQLSENLN